MENEALEILKKIVALDKKGMIFDQYEVRGDGKVDKRISQELYLVLSEARDCVKGNSNKPT